MSKKKILRLKVIETYDNYTSETLNVPTGVEYREVDDDEYNLLANAVVHWNRSHYDQPFKIFQIADDSTIDLIVGEYQKEQEKIDAKRTAVEKKRQANAVERKRKQLEKLKKELGED